MTGILPSGLEREVKQVLNDHTGKETEILTLRRMGGGCIHAAAELVTDHGSYFLKWNPNSLPGMFLREAEGLNLLRLANAIRVPDVFTASEKMEDCPAFLLLEFIPPTNRQKLDQFRLGCELAALHRFSSHYYGLEADNYIGSSPQRNNWTENWVEFFAQQRLTVQMQIAMKNGVLSVQRKRQLDYIIAHVERWLGGISRIPALIHGDLWGGNVMGTGNGQPVIFDPAVYYADREAEIAFTELFGGFSTEFYCAYQEAFPLEPGYVERRELYNLYHLLNHLNLFGEGYGGQVDAVLSRYAGKI